jgi:hypothetical protein
MYEVIFAARDETPRGASPGRRPSSGAMSTISRIPEIILRQRAIARSLPAFGLALASAAVGLVMLAVHV